MTFQHPGHLLHRLDTRTIHPPHPFPQETGGPQRRAVLPESLEVLALQTGTHRFEVVLRELLQLHRLLVRQVLASLEQAPTGMLQDVFVAISLQLLGLGGADLW